MKKRIEILMGLKCLAIGAALLVGACAFGPDMPDHAFDFDTWTDSPDIEVLNYEYGNSRQPGVRPSAEALRLDQVGQQTNVNGQMLRGDFLYVKWRIRRTGQVYEDRVDLRHRLPKDLTGCRIHFVVDGTQLFVYVIYPEKVAGLCPANDQEVFNHTRPQKRVLLEYCDLKITQIYPDQSKTSGTGDDR